MTNRIAILISGGGSNMVSLMDSFTASHPAHAVVVVSISAGAGGLRKAAERGVATAVVDHRPFAGDRVAFEVALSDALSRYAPDFICLAGFMRILTPSFAEKWTDKILNIHPSLLPKYIGLNTHARAIEAGDRFAGCSVHRLTADLDAGAVLGQAVVPILEHDTAQGLAARVLIQEHRLYPKVLRRVLEGKDTPLYLS